MNKRFISGMLTLLMLTSFLAGCTGTDDTSTPSTANDITTNTTKIGLLSPQTGPIAAYASGFESAAAVAIADLNAEQSTTTFELVVADSGCSGTTAATAAQTLIDSGVVGIAGAACSGATLGAIAVAKEAGVPMVSYASTSPAVTTSDDGGHLFRVVPSDAQQAVALKDLVLNRSGADVTIGVLYMTNDYGSGLADNFEVAWNGTNVSGSPLCAKAGYDPVSFDASTLVQAVLSCDILVTVTYATDGAAIVEELAVQGYTGQIYGADGIADANFGTEFSDKHTLNGVIATQPRPGTTSAMKTAFETAYAAAGGNASGIYTHETYDAVKVIGQAYNMLVQDGVNMKTHIGMVGNAFVGASGTHTFDANGDVLGTGYNACDFTITGTFDALNVGFACDQIWTAAGGIADAASEDSTGSGKIKIGLLSPQTGPIAVYADGFEDAAAVAIAKLNADNANMEFELVVANSGCGATQAATGAQTLIDSGVVGIVGAACSGATLGAIAVAKEAGIPMVSYASTSPAVTTADDNDLLFRVVTSDAYQGPAISAVVADSGVTNPGLLYMTNDYGSGLADAFEGAWTDTENTLCAKAGYEPGSLDASTLVQAVLSCDSVVLVSYATDGAAIVEELAAQTFSGQIFGGDGIADLPFQEEFSDNSSLDGVIATKPASASDADFEAAYGASAGNASAIYTHETYDAVMMIGLAAAMENGANMKTHLRMVGNAYDGASGNHTFDANGDVSGSGYSICAFSYDAGTSTVSFACARKWDSNAGITDV